MRASAVTGAAVLLLTAACAAPAASAPVRPQSLDLEGVDMCHALSDAQIRSLHLRGGGVETPGDATNRTGPGCVWIRSSAESAETFGIRPGFVDVEKLAPSPRGSGDGRLTVAGYPAVETHIRGQGEQAQNTCTVSVGVAPDRSLGVIYAFNGPASDTTREKACRNATEVAEMAMQTLLARKKDS